jgi:hypothetical protein
LEDVDEEEADSSGWRQTENEGILVGAEGVWVSEGGDERNVLGKAWDVPAMARIFSHDEWNESQ